MHPRNPEAQRLEDDYLARLHRALRGLPADEASEIEQNVRDHIESSLAGERGETSLTRMAAILEELGAPDILASESGLPPAPAAKPDPTPAPAPAPAPAPEPAADPPPPPPPITPPPVIETPQATTDDRTRFRNLLERVLMAYFIIIAGLYIPILDIYVCWIIGYTVLLMSLRDEADSQLFYGAGTWACLSISLVVISSILSVITLAVPFMALLNLPVLLAGTAVLLVTDWKILGGCADIAERNGSSSVADFCRKARVIWVMIGIGIVVVGLIIGIVIGMAHPHYRPKLGTEILWMCIMLPIGWILGALFMIRPIMQVRRVVAARP